MANRPSQGWTTRAARTSGSTRVRTSTTRAESLVTDELVDYAQLGAQDHEGAPAIGERTARLYTRLRRHPGARPPDPRALRPDGALRGLDHDLNHIADSRLVLLNNCGRWPPFEKPAEWTAQVPAGLMREMARRRVQLTSPGSNRNPKSSRFIREASAKTLRLMTFTRQAINNRA
jgi:hypothetical protein